MQKNQQVPLSQLRSAVAKFKNGRPSRTKKYPESIQQLAIEAVQSGLSVAQVAAVSHVSTFSIYKWCRRGKLGRSGKAARPKRLKIIDETVSTASLVPMARIHFRSGICMDIPIEGLDVSVLGRLHQVGGGL